MAKRIIPINQAYQTRQSRQARKRVAQPPLERVNTEISADAQDALDQDTLDAMSALCANLCPAQKLAVTLAEAAWMLSISRSHLYPLVMREEIPSFHIGRSHLISRRALEEWIRQQEEAA